MRIGRRNLAFVAAVWLFTQWSELPSYAAPASGPATTAPTTAASAWKDFADDANGIRFSYPAAWTLGKQGKSVVFATSQRPTTNPSGTPGRSVQVMARAGDAEPKLDEVFERDKKRLASGLTDFKLLRESSSPLAGHPARDMIFTFTVEGRAMEMAQAYAVVGNVLYMVSAMSPADDFAAFAPTVKEFLRSLELGVRKKAEK